MIKIILIIVAICFFMWVVLPFILYGVLCCVIFSAIVDWYKKR